MNDGVDRLSAALTNRYRIDHELGAGGMATVYLAEDLKHRRKVALKVLRPELAAILGPDRFLKEIEVTANLQHPNILPLYDSGEAASLLYYVMPYVEGESLRQRLNREKQLSAEDAVAIARAVADALQYAHERGVIHRDIKPENILLTHGQPLVADFGIALAISHAGGTRLTETGLSLGTPHYMSPEQATGDRELDARTDVYSLGATVYEMLVGEPPHVGNSAQAVIARILSDTPAPITRSRALVPPNVEAAVQRALAKSPADRFASAARFAEALANPAFRLPASPLPVMHRKSDRRLPVLTALLALTAALALWGWLRPGGDLETRAGVRRLTIELPDSAPLAVGTGRPALAITDDGTRIAYVARVQGDHVIMVKDLVSDEVMHVTGSLGGTGPSLSRSDVALFIIGEDILAAPLATGRAQRVASATPVTRGVAWLSDSSAAVALSPNNGIMVVPFFNDSLMLGPKNSLTWLTPEQNPRAWPEVLPGARAMVYAIPEGLDPDGWRIAGRSLQGGAERIIVEGGSNPQYDPSGHLLFARQGALWAVPFDANRMEARGGPILVQRGVITEPEGAAHFAISQEGTLVYAAGGDWQTSRRLVWVSPDGSLVPVSLAAGVYTEVALAPDGRRAALTSNAGSGPDVWLADLTRGSLTRVTNDPGEDGSPVWSPDGTRLAIATEQFGEPPKLALVDLAKPAPTLAVDTGGAISAPTAWSGDGRSLFFTTSSIGRGRPPDGAGIDLLDPTTGKRSTWLQTADDERAAVLSPDGNWVAYVSNASGRPEVYIRARAVESAPIPVSTEGGVEPRWGRSGRTLYFRQGDRILVVTVPQAMTAAGPDLPPPRVAFRLPETLYLVGGFNRPAWDIAASERRLLALEEVAQVRVTKLNVVLNWPEALKAKLPSR